jgi:hypothetical protein
MTARPPGQAERALADGPGPPVLATRPQCFPTVNRVCMARLCGRAGRLTAQNGDFRPLVLPPVWSTIYLLLQKVTSPRFTILNVFPARAEKNLHRDGRYVHLWDNAVFAEDQRLREGTKRPPRDPRPWLPVQGLDRSAYDAFGVFGAIFRELEWKTPIFSWRAVPKTPNASYAEISLCRPPRPRTQGLACRGQVRKRSRWRCGGTRTARWCA